MSHTVSQQQGWLLRASMFRTADAAVAVLVEVADPDHQNRTLLPCRHLKSRSILEANEENVFSFLVRTGFSSVVEPMIIVSGRGTSNVRIFNFFLFLVAKPKSLHSYFFIFDHGLLTCEANDPTDADRIWEHVGCTWQPARRGHRHAGRPRRTQNCCGTCCRCISTSCHRHCWRISTRCLLPARRERMERRVQQGMAV